MDTQSTYFRTFIDKWKVSTESFIIELIYSLYTKLYHRKSLFFFANTFTKISMRWWLMNSRLIIIIMNSFQSLFFLFHLWIVTFSFSLVVFIYILIFDFIAYLIPLNKVELTHTNSKRSSENKRLFMTYIKKKEIWKFFFSFIINDNYIPSSSRFKRKTVNEKKIRVCYGFNYFCLVSI